MRILGKYVGAFLGALLSKSSKEIRYYLGLALVPQAEVSIGLAALGQRMLPAQSGTLFATIILSSAVLYEMIGPACAKTSLILAGAIPRDADGASLLKRPIQRKPPQKLTESEPGFPLRNISPLGMKKHKELKQPQKNTPTDGIGRRCFI